MVAKPTPTKRISRELELAFLMLEELDDNVTHWNEMSDWEQDDWHLEWGQFVNNVEYKLHIAYQSGQMTSKQQSKYKELLSKLKKAAPTLKKLNLSQPPVSLAEIV